MSLDLGCSRLGQGQSLRRATSSRGPAPPLPIPPTAHAIHGGCSTSASRALLKPRQAGLHGGCKPSRLVCQSTDYVASASDEGVLKLSPRTELGPDQIQEVFGYPRNLNERYQQGRMMGAGSFGVVREAIEITTGRKYAVKTVGKSPKRGAPTPRYLLKLRNEVEIMQQLGYSLDAVNLKDVFEDNENIHLVMDLCTGGALLERIEQRQYSEKYIARIVRSILRFISQCHAKGIIYRDVKPDNFLFLSKEAEAPLKATDFGLSIRHWPDEPKLTSRSGTPAYMAPELVLQSYDEKCDIWSVGMLAYQLLTGRFPFWDDVRNQSLNDVWKSILYTDIDWNAEELDQLSRSAVDFLKSLLQREPSKRPSAFQALQHPWVRERGTATDLPLKGTTVQRLQRFSTYGHLKQMVLKMIVDEIQYDRESMDEAVSPQGVDHALSAKQALKSSWLLWWKKEPAGLDAVGVDVLMDLFKQLDTDNSGSISFEELSRGLRTQGYILNDNEVEQLMRKVDRDHDGNIVLNEFMTTLIDWSLVQQDAAWQRYVERAFQHLDRDKDGFISLDELIDELKKQAPDLLETELLKEAKIMLREADTNGDGRISKEEFYDLLKDNHAPDSLSFYDDRLASHAQRPPSNGTSGKA